MRIPFYFLSSKSWNNFDNFQMSNGQWQRNGDISGVAWCWCDIAVDGHYFEFFNEKSATKTDFWWAVKNKIWQFLTSLFYVRHLLFSGVWLILSAIGCVALNIFTDSNWTVLSFVVFLSCCSSSNIVLAVGVNVFPTRYRGMASSLIMMFGRLGGSAGSTLVGVLLSQYCTSIFYIYGVMLISKCHQWILRNLRSFF